MPLSPQGFQKILQRAWCEKIAHEEGKKEFLVTVDERKNPLFIEYNLHLMMYTDYRILEEIDAELTEVIPIENEIPKDIFQYKYKLDKEMKRGVEHVLIRCLHEFRLSKDINGDYWCETNLPKECWERIVERANYEKEVDENNKMDFLLTAKEAMRIGFITYSLDFMNRSNFLIDDVDEYLEMLYVD